MFVIFAICFLIILLYFLQDFGDWKKHSKVHNKVYSSNGLLVTYMYSVPVEKEKVIERLCMRREDDKLFYRFDEETLQIQFADPEVEFNNSNYKGVTFQLHFEEKENSCLLYVEQKEIIVRYGARIGTLMNTFWACKIGAEAIKIEYE